MRHASTKTKTPAARSAGRTAGRSAGHFHARRVVVVLAELLLVLASVCVLFVLWQLWWTGVQAERVQAEDIEQAGWTDPGSSEVTVAQAQEGDAPVQPTSADYGELIAQVYVPRFGQGWERNLVEGTDAVQLDRHGLGHYTNTQMPGALGNFAVAGHRDGYGEPLGDIDKLQEGDAIVVRTRDYWYVYTYTSHTIVEPDETDVLDPVPGQPSATADKRRITLTSCEPKYATPTHRWIAFGELRYWAKVSDGVPEELVSTDSTGKVTFAVNPSDRMSLAARVGSLGSWIRVALLVWLVVFVAAAVAWRWPAFAKTPADRNRHARARHGRARLSRPPSTSVCGWLLRLQPGVLPVRVILLVLLMFALVASLFEWVFPWAAANIPVLQEYS